MILQTIPSRPVTLLYVEDEQEPRDIVLSLLEISFPHANIYWAENGYDGLDRFLELRPDIVVTDINMPRMNGIEMARAIKKISPETIIIAATAYSETDLLLKAIEIGFNHFVLKPLDYEKLCMVVENAVAEVSRMKQLRIQDAHISKLSQALEQSPSSVIITDQGGTIEYVNHKFIERSGYEYDDMVGKNIRLLKSGQTGQSVYENIWDSITNGKEWHGELCSQKKNNDLYWELASIAPLFDQDGNISNYVAVNEDITTLKLIESELKALNRQLETRSRELEVANQSLEAFNYTVSHDLRSPLTVIHGFVEVLLKKFTDDKHVREYFEIIYSEVNKMNSLISTLLKFSRLSAVELSCEEVDLSNIASVVSHELSMRCPERCVSFIITRGLRCVGDYALLRIVFENIIGNALKYTSQRSKAIIEFGVQSQGTRKIYFLRDNGAGFDNKKSAQLFKTFTRLHCDSEFEGFGIGLATVQRIIEKHGGTVWAEGEIDKGACIYFMLPDSCFDE